MATIILGMRNFSINCSDEIANVKTVGFQMLFKGPQDNCWDPSKRLNIADASNTWVTCSLGSLINAFPHNGSEASDILRISGFRLVSCGAS